MLYTEEENSFQKNYLLNKVNLFVDFWGFFYLTVMNCYVWELGQNMIISPVRLNLILSMIISHRGP